MSIEKSGLVAVKTLLSRDPCAHAKVAIEMLDVLIKQPAREWVGLTDEEMLAIKFANSSMGVFCINYDLNKMLLDAEAKLREKNEHKEKNA